jgi:DNA-binding MarR family transcriptional regulator
VSKQAAAKTAHGLERAGYLSRRTDPGDRRAVVLVRTERAEDLLARSEAFFARWLEESAAEVGAARLATTVDVLRRLGGEAPVGDLPGWLLAGS